MKKTLFVLAVASFVFACGKHYPNDPVICQSDSDCGGGQSCLAYWEHSDGGAADGGSSCISTKKSCQKQCSTDTDCGFCGTFGICAKDACDTTGPTTCGVFCSDGK